MKKKLKIVIVLSLLAMVIFCFALYWVIHLRTAHLTFDNYYKFRGCEQLINRTDDYGVCRLHSGDIIKIVRYENRWYLDGDLPCGFLCF
jgi:hypothetical protein